MIEQFRRVTDLAAMVIGDVLTNGDTAIDATAGMGSDTCLLAHKVGAAGHVYAFDIQARAIECTREKLINEGLLEQVTLCQCGHEMMAKKVGPDKKVKGIMFNLGYFPSGDKTVITTRETTLEALEAAVILLEKRGVITLCLYRHETGQDECEAVEAWCRELSGNFRVHKFETINRKAPPYLIVIEKIK